MITITIFVVMGVSANHSSKLNWFNNIVSVPLTPIQKFFSFSGGKIEGSLALFKDTKAVKKENDDLKAKIDQLEKDKRELLRYRDENNELRATLNLKNQFNDYDSIGANVIAKDPGNWFNIFRIDRGSKDGIVLQSKDGANEYYPVITSKGLVGMVINSDLLSSKVISIIDVGSSVSAIISKSRDPVVIKGSLALMDQGLCRMDNIPSDADITHGDTIETSGMGGIFPKGILIGTIEEVLQTGNEMSRYATIKPAVDFKRLEQVFVWKSKTNNQGTVSVGK
jgi:rod shape-determining protein MreC